MSQWLRRAKNGSNADALVSTIAVSVLLYSQGKKGTRTGLELKIDLALVTRSRSSPGETLYKV